MHMKVKTVSLPLQYSDEVKQLRGYNANTVDGANSVDGAGQYGGSLKEDSIVKKRNSTKEISRSIWLY